MHVSAKTEYACIAVLELALRCGTGEPVRTGTIAEAHGIPPRFLVQILLQLKGAGLVASTRGAAGGYRLAKDPAEITLGELMGVVEGPANSPVSNATISTPTSEVLHSAWSEVSRLEREMLSATTFADLVEQVRGRTESMYYI